MSDTPEITKADARKIIDDIISGKIKDKVALRKAKIKLSRESSLSGIISNSKIFEHATESEKKDLGILVRKPVRTISGVAVVAVMCRPGKCPGNCIYCPDFDGAPRSYTGKEPAAMRAERMGHDPFKQVEHRLFQLGEIGHKTSKVELIVMGGTFPSEDWEYQQEFVKRCFDAMNGSCSSDLKSAQKLNETSGHRCVGLTIETRPDFSKCEQIDRFLELGATRVELGVQTTSDEIYKKVNRGHTVLDVIESTRQLKDAGYKVCYHYMPGLLVDAEADIKLFSALFENPDFRPDMLKMYPTLIIKGTKLYGMWKKGEYTPYDNDEAVSVIARMKALVPSYVRIMRVQRDIPAYNIESGSSWGNLREVVAKKCSELDIKCKCIRCREAGHSLYKKNIRSVKPEIYIEKYDASEGVEFFISKEDKKIGVLEGYLRMRYPSGSFRPEIDKDTAIVRELKVVGATVPVGEKGVGLQHKGLGSELMRRAEEIAKADGKNKMVVISAVGTRKYYEKLGYAQDGPYMSKGL
ncbi:MAG: tRNA uridine(34) 5-carboxymethylaminomethyl modification radical SAM/GNAT enzyme Elp3 [Nanohaloarchaea archaeon]|nr:tRNA uridine(34) 5-carboxymethylaminomethyl modification radical SAM/GNAT enzyme Elp3 [Candidatus Nanohaloarchaea archaeon]